MTSDHHFVPDFSGELVEAQSRILELEYENAHLRAKLDGIRLILEGEHWPIEPK